MHCARSRPLLPSFPHVLRMNPVTSLEQRSAPSTPLGCGHSSLPHIADPDSTTQAWTPAATDTYRPSGCPTRTKYTASIELYSSSSRPWTHREGECVVDAQSPGIPRLAQPVQQRLSRRISTPVTASSFHPRASPRTASSTSVLRRRRDHVTWNRVGLFR